MNPSRIGTPVDKKIDEWFFRFMGKDIKFIVYIKRDRDAQARDGHVPRIRFKAAVTYKEIEAAKIDPKKFASASFENEDINALRVTCEKHCQQMMALKWERCIVVGFDTGKERRDDIFNHGKLEGRRMNPYVELNFDFAVALRSGEYFRYLEDDDDREYWQMSADRVLCGSWWNCDKKSLVVLPYDETTVAALTRIKDSYLELNRRVLELLQPDQIHKLVDNIRNLLPETTHEH